MRRRVVLLAALGACWRRGAAAQSLSDAIGVFGRERSLGESTVGLLKRYAPEDIDGRALYAQAKAEFDGLIEQMLADLADRQDPQLSPAFRERLDRALARCAAFSAHAEAVITPRIPAGAKPDWLAVIAGLGNVLPDTVKALVDAGIAIWREFRAANAERRREIEARVEAQRWKPWAEIPAAP